jgi:biopolymer transport protein ExbD
MNFGEKTRKRTTINITALVDILIVLLLFFMLTTQFIHMEILNLNVSEAGKTKTNEGSQKPVIIITLTGDGKFTLNGNEYNLAQLQEIISPKLEHPFLTEIIVNCLENAKVQDVVTAIDSIKLAGGQNISIAEDK